ncbi:MAG: hypothetical protein HY718_17350 [Planctomycetes bacterium]|nr:hypothetical protein [Planctomycetota bacterium]
MGYDIELIVMNPAAGTTFPVEPAAADKLIVQAALSLDADAVRTALLAVSGARPGPEGAVDYVGPALGYARLTVKPKAVHVDNNCSPKELLRIQAALTKAIGTVFIRDLQSRQLHDADSFMNWWTKPL